MSKIYEIEIVTGKGNRWAKMEYKSILDARKRALREIGTSKSTFVYIHQLDRGVPGGLRSTVERIEFDDYIGDYAVQQYTTHRRYRVSKNTGKLLDLSREFKYLGPMGN